MTDAPRRIITIDGPAGAGKSTVGRRVARAISFQFLDTGAVYRVATLAALRAGVPLDRLDEGPDDDEAGAIRAAALAAFEAAEVSLTCNTDGPATVTMSGEDVSLAIRAEHVTARIRHLSALPQVRELATAHQRRFAERGDFVCDGRDQGTVVFPDAQLKVYLTASSRERAMRRQRDLARQGEHVDLDELERRIRERDASDMNRADGPLRKAADAVEVDSSTLTADQVIETIVGLARERFGLEG